MRLIALIGWLFLLPASAANFATLVSENKFEVINGEALDLQSQFKSRPVYLKFWATWCVPCNEQMPHFQQAFEQFGQDIQFVSVNLGVNETETALAQMFAKYKLTMPTIVDESGKLAQALGLNGTPWHILINASGQIVHKGHEADTELDRRLSLLANNSDELPVLILNNAQQKPLQLNNQPGTSLLYFTATWCDWYFADSRPNDSQRCIQGQKQLNKLLAAHSELSAIGILSRMYTGEKEIKGYTERYQVKHPLLIDAELHAYIGYKISQFPTLIVLKDGKEVGRTTEFSDQVLSNLLKL